jgi:PKD repeat protein
MQRGEIFTVADPYITILTLDDSSPPQNVNGKSVSRGDLLTFRIDTNMNLIYNGLRTVKPGDIDQNMNIKVRNPVGTTFTSLYDSGLTPQPIINQYVNVDPWFWFVYWATGAQVTHPDYYYQGGTYTIWAESTLNGMKDNYLDTGHTYWGKTASLQHQVTLVAAPPPTADFTANPRTVTTSQPVEFTDASPGSPTGWAWFFGDESYTEAWTEQSASAGWTAGPGSDSVVLPDGSIVLVRNGVWRSTDKGTSWTQVNPSPGFGGGDTVVMPDGTMLHMNYIDIGGGYQQGEVWQSTDKGTTWTQVTMAANWDPSSHYTSLQDCVALPDGTILLTYYHSMAGEWTALERSTDQGVTWTSVVSIPWDPRKNFDLTAMPDGSVIMTGGSDWYGNYNDVWISTDKGSTWSQRKPNDANGWTARYDHTTVAMPDGSIVLMGGWGTILGRDEVWRSTDNGATWTLLTSNAAWPARTGATSVAMPDGSIVLMGGQSEPGVGLYNDVWRLIPAGSSAQYPSHTYTTPGTTYQVALQVYNDGGYSSIRKPDYITILGEDKQAYDIFINDPDGPCGGSSCGGTLPAGSSASISDKSLDSGATVKQWRPDLAGRTTTTPAVKTWLVMYDPTPQANWEHPVTYYYVSISDGEIVGQYEAVTPPEDINQDPIPMHLIDGVVPDVVGLTPCPSVNMFRTMIPASSCFSQPDTTHNYALLIAGGVDKEHNSGRYYNDIKFMYNTLVTEYGYDKEHIKVLMSDGPDNLEEDKIDSYTGNTPNYGNSNPDLDENGVLDVNGPATRDAVNTALNDLNGVLTGEDTLFIFTTNHGGWDGVVSPDGANNNAVFLYLWHGDYITDEDFVANLPANAGSITMTMGQCYGGGFINEFITSTGTQTRVIETAANGDEFSNSNDFTYPWTSAVAGHDTALNPTDADVSLVDSRVSMSEAYTYALGRDASARSGVEHPQKSAYAADADATQFLGPSCPAPSKSITVPAVTGTTTKTITWDPVGLLPSETVKIELWKNSQWGMLKQLDIATSVLASAKTKSWTVPASLPSGTGDDYQVKVSSTTTPQVWGMSPRFSLTATAQRAGSMTIKTGTDQQGATIWINDVDTGFTTDKQFTSMPPLTYPVKVALSGYYPVGPTNVKINPGYPTTKPFTLERVQDSPGAILSVRYLVVDSVPEGANVVIKNVQSGAVTEMVTHAEKDMAPGTYDVYATKDGYTDSNHQTITIPGYTQDNSRCSPTTTNVNLALGAPRNIGAKVLIVPQPLNIGRPSSYFVAFVTLPSGYKAADVKAETVTCEGIPALKLFRDSKLFPQTFAAVFSRQDLGEITPKDTVKTVTMTVQGAIRKSGGDPLFTGISQVKVTNKKTTTKEDIDTVMKLTFSQLFKFFK